MIKIMIQNAITFTEALTGASSLTIPLGGSAKLDEKASTAAADAKK